MKRIGLYMLFALMAVVLPSAQNGDLLTFAQTSHDLGNISDKDDPVTVVYEFTNTSDSPVAVLSVSSGCGCTRTEYPTQPIAAGESNKITVTFVPTGVAGEINKNIKVRYRGATARGSKQITLRLRGSVIPSS